GDLRREPGPQKPAARRGFALWGPRRARRTGPAATAGPHPNPPPHAGRERVLIDRTPCQADPPTRGGRGAPLRCATRSPTNSPRVRGTGVVGVRVRATARPILPACGGRGGTPWLCGGAGAR